MSFLEQDTENKVVHDSPLQKQMPIYVDVNGRSFFYFILCPHLFTSMNFLTLTIAAHVLHCNGSAILGFLSFLALDSGKKDVHRCLHYASAPRLCEFEGLPASFFCS